MQKTIDLTQLSKILDLTPNTVRTYLGNYRFSKYIISKIENRRRKNVYILNTSFVKDLSRFLFLRGNFSSLKHLTKFYGISFNFLDYEDDYDA